MVRVMVMLQIVRVFDSYMNDVVENNVLVVLFGFVGIQNQHMVSRVGY